MILKGDCMDKGNRFYVYEWYNIDTKEVFYVGKGCGNRLNSKNGRNDFFTNYLNRHNCSVRKIKENINEEDAYSYEKKIISGYRKIKQCRCNIEEGGLRGDDRIHFKNENHKKTHYDISRMYRSNDKFSLTHVEKYALFQTFEAFELFPSRKWFNLLDAEEKNDFCELYMENIEIWQAEEDFDDDVRGWVTDGAYGSFDEFWEHYI
jgi:hypothetical protein